MELITRKIRWLVNDINLNSASLRYRCFHFARYFEQNFNFKSIFYTESQFLAKYLEKGDTVIIVKNLDVTINNVVLRAYAMNIPVIVDICDNLIDPYYKNNEFLTSNNNLISLSNFITKITVPNHSLKLIIQDCLKDCLRKPELFVLPDPSETAQDVVLTAKYLKTKWKEKGRERKNLEFNETFEENRGNKLLWFGNSSSTTSNMGFVSLIPHLRIIKTYH